MTNEMPPLQAGIGAKDTLVGLISTQPGLAFILRHWRMVLIFSLLVAGSTLSIAAWQYHKYMTTKVLELNVELARSKDQALLLDAALTAIRADMATAVSQFTQFQTDIQAIKKNNAELRKKIIGLSMQLPPGTSEVDAQSVIDGVRLDIATKWGQLGSAQ